MFQTILERIMQSLASGCLIIFCGCVLCCVPCSGIGLNHFFFYLCLY